MRRREFIAGFGGAAASVLTAHAQQVNLTMIYRWAAGGPASAREVNPL